MKRTSKYDSAEKAIRDLFSDTSVAPGETRDMLEDLRDLITELAEALPEL